MARYASVALTTVLVLRAVVATDQSSPTLYPPVPTPAPPGAALPATTPPVTSTTGSVTAATAVTSTSATETTAAPTSTSPTTTGTMAAGMGTTLSTVLMENYNRGEVAMAINGLDYDIMTAMEESTVSKFIAAAIATGLNIDPMWVRNMSDYPERVTLSLGKNATVLNFLSERRLGNPLAATQMNAIYKTAAEVYADSKATLASPEFLQNLAAQISAALGTNQSAIIHPLSFTVETKDLPAAHTTWTTSTPEPAPKEIVTTSSLVICASPSCTTTSETTTTMSTTSTTAAAGSSGGWLWWLLIPLCLVCLSIAAFAAFQGSKGSKSKRSAPASKLKPSPPAEDTRPLVDKTAMSTFDMLDTNHDGIIDRAEFQAYEKTKAPMMMTPPSLPAPVLTAPPAPPLYTASMPTTNVVPVQTMTPMQPQVVYAAPAQRAVAAPVMTAPAMTYAAPQVTYGVNPVAAQAQSLFDAVDTNHDGVITRAEFQALMGQR